jgi:hypothetical protein
MNAFRVKFSSLNYFFYFDDDAVSSLGHVLVEVSFGHLELQVSLGVSSFGLDDGKVSEESFFSNVLFAVEDSSLFWLRQDLRLKFGFSFLYFLVVIVMHEFNWKSSSLYQSAHSR